MSGGLTTGVQRTLLSCILNTVTVYISMCAHLENERLVISWFFKSHLAAVLTVVSHSWIKRPYFE